MREFSVFGEVRKGIVNPRGAGRPAGVYVLNTAQFELFGVLLSNTDNAVKFKVNVIRERGR